MSKPKLTLEQQVQVVMKVLGPRKSKPFIPLKKD